ncbi:hypothetical protein ABZV31_16445, partial [Streptomyces sp. NPDC005202]
MASPGGTRELTPGSDKAREPVAGPGGAREPVAGPGGAREPVAGPGGAREPVAGPDKAREPVAGPDGAREPVAGPDGAREPVAGPDGARELMVAAVRECEAALGAADDEEARRRLVAELGHTHRQFGDLLARSVAKDAEDGAIRAAFEEALDRMARAIVAFGSLGDDGLHDRTGAELAAGWLEADLNRPAAAAARARAVLQAYAGATDGDETVRARQAEAEQLLQLMEEQQAN